MAGFKNRLHEQLARRTAREAFREATSTDNPVAVSCEPCTQEFSGTTEQELSKHLEAHYKTSEHRRNTNLTIAQQRAARQS